MAAKEWKAKSLDRLLRRRARRADDETIYTEAVQPRID